MKPTPRTQYLVIIQKKINYTFKNIDLLNRALTHRSFSAHNYERLEFIGDSILDYVIAQMLYDTFPSLPEGRLSQMRSQLVKEATLAEIARELNLGQALFLGGGEIKSGGNDRTSILADVLAAQTVIRQLFDDRIKQLNTHTQAKDCKTQLQEFLQAKKFALPKYRIEHQEGEGEFIRFDVSCDLGELGHITYAHANSRRAAEQECAKQALAWLNHKFSKK